MIPTFWRKAVIQKTDRACPGEQWRFLHPFCRGVFDTYMYCATFDEAIKQLNMHQDWHKEHEYC